MAVKPKPRTILEHLAESAIDSRSSPVKSLAIANLPDGHTIIYIGTLSGVLLSYSLRVAEAIPPEITFIRRTSLPGTGSGSSVNSIHPLVHIGKLIVYANGFLFLIDSSFVESAKRLSLFKGVTAFTRKFRSVKYGYSSLHANVGIQTSSISSNGSSGSIKNFFAIGIGKKLVLAELILSGSLVIMKEIQGAFDGVVTSLLWLDDSVFLGTMNGYYLYNCVTGQCGLIFSLPVSSCMPRMYLLVKDSRVLLMVDNVGVIVDMEGQPVEGSLVFKEAPDSLRDFGSYVVTMMESTMELYHKKTGFCVQRLIVGGVGSEGPCMLVDEENDGGKLVLSATSSKLLCYGKVSAEEQIKDLLRRKNFKEAISLVNELENECEMTTEMLSFVHAQVGFLLLFDLHFKEAIDHFLLSENMQPSEVFPFIMPDPNRWTLLVPRNRYWGLHPPPSPIEKVIDDGLTSIQRAVFLKKAGLESARHDDFLLNPPNKEDLLESAIENMIRYLQASREKDLTVSVREGVDTLLMYLYRALNSVEDMERLATSENYCVVEELETLLNDSGHLRTLAFLCAGKGMSAKALAIWRILSRNYSSSSYASNQLQDADFPNRSTKFPNGSKVVASEASKILEEISDQELVLQHLGWIADIDQMLAVQVLISEGRQNLLSPDKVIAAIDPKKVEILQRYLQWLIEDQDSEDSQFHTKYALLLAKSALETYEEDFLVDIPDKDNKISELGQRSIFESPVRERLQIFLGSSDLYDAEQVLDTIEESELWLEKAILYRKLGQETLVLQILALKLGNCEGAEEYCAEIGRPDAYIELLDMYLDPKDGREPMFKAAVTLLHNHGELLDPLQILERLSPSMPLQLASDTMLRMLRARHHHRYQGHIVHNISRALEVDSSLARLEERSRHLVINDESFCDSCHARLGTKLFAMYPDDTVVCYKCYSRQGESTSVSGRDFKEDILIKPGWLVTR